MDEITNGTATFDAVVTMVGDKILSINTNTSTDKRDVFAATIHVDVTGNLSIDRKSPTANEPKIQAEESMKKITVLKINNQAGAPAFIAEMSNHLCVRGSHQMSSVGWVNPNDDYDDSNNNVDQLSFDVRGNLAYRVNVGVDQVAIPEQVVSRRVTKNVLLTQRTQSRILSTKEVKTIRDEVIFELLPTMHSVVSTVPVYVDFENDLVLIGSTNRKTISLVAELLDKSGVSVAPMPSISELMNTWFSERSFPTIFDVIGCVLNVGGIKKTLKGSAFTLNKAAVFIDDGAVVCGLILRNDHIRCTINDDFSLTSVELNPGIVKTFDQMLDFQGESITTADILLNSNSIITIAKNAVAPIVEPVVDPVVEPVVDPVVEPVVDPVIDPVVDPVIDPVVA